jgi:pyruvate/2-oxoglutarate dehydrogenase complex dihydrolipoamide dehydrogenase (E3) component
MAVIGGGSAGLTAAGMSAVLGAKTVLIEEKKLGGDCTWYGCIPSKALLKAAKVAHQMRTAGRCGLATAACTHDLDPVMQHVRSIRESVYQDADAPPNMEKLGVEVIAAQAGFLDPHTVEIASRGRIRRLTSRYFVVATGSTPRMPAVDGADRVQILNNETVFDLRSLPAHLLILGAGPIGIEMAQAFQRLGAGVTVIEKTSRILARDDSELSASLTDRLRNEGIRFRFNTEVIRMAPGLAHAQGGESLPFDAVFSALGRTPNIDGLNLGAAGVATSREGVIVNRRCRSSAKHIYACGDVTGKYLFTHMAEHMAKVAVKNALLHVPATTDDQRVPWCTFTDPELAHVGRSEEELRTAGIRYRVYRFPFSQLDRAMAESEAIGLVKILANRRGTILGASILGANAGEMIAEFALAMRGRIGLNTISDTIHPYPTYALGNRRAADMFVTGKLTPTLVSWIQRLFGLRGDLRGIRSLRN